MKTTLTVLTLAVALGCGLAAPAFADDSAEDRFHAAYVQEVVDGKVADAAKTYLALTTADDAPETIRREARFRFAVCTVLLGRVDEARVQLGELLRDDKADAAFKARVRQYLDALQDVGMGKALDEKLQELTFELARQMPGGDADMIRQYRDFEVLGDAARPFLRELLTHSDFTLRVHAFRLLLRMDEPGMVARLPAGLPLTPTNIAKDWNEYASRVEGARDELETALLAMPPEQMRSVLVDEDRPTVEFSPGFVEKARMRGLPVEAAVQYLAVAEPGAARIGLFESWVTSEDEELSRIATEGLLLEIARSWVDVEDLPSELLPKMVRRLTTREPWNLHSNLSGNQASEHAGLKTWAQTVPESVALDALAGALDARSSWHEANSFEKVNASFLVPLAVAVGQKAATRDLDVPDERTVDVLEQYIVACREAQSAAVEQQDHRAVERNGGGALYLLQHVMPRLDEVSAERLAEIARTQPAWASPSGIVLALPYESEAQCRRVRESLLELSAKEQYRVLEGWRRMFASKRSIRWPRELARLVADVSDDLLTGSPADQLSIVNALRDFVIPDVFLPIPPEEAREALIAMASTIDGPANGAQESLVMRFLDAPQLRGSNEEAGQQYLRTVLVPALDRLNTALEPSQRQWRLYRACENWLRSDENGSMDLDEARDAIAAFLLNHLPETVQQVGKVLPRYRDLFLPEQWVPRVPHDAWNGMGISASDDPAVVEDCRRLLVDPGPTNRSVVAYVSRSTSSSISRKLLAPFLQQGDVATVAAIFETTDDFDADTLDSVVRRFATNSDLGTEALRSMTIALNRERPTRNLFPAVRRLLRSDDAPDVQTGIRIAESLGQRDLVPDLIRLLDSLDGERRKAARAAIDSILELDRLRNEAKIMDKLGGNGDEPK